MTQAVTHWQQGLALTQGWLNSWNLPTHMKELFMGSGKRQQAHDISRCCSAAEVSEWMREGFLLCLGGVSSVQVSTEPQRESATFTAG